MADQVGQLEIGAEIDLDSLQESFTRLETSLNDLGGKFDSINSDMIRTEKSSKGISLGFIGIAGATTAILGLAKASPQLTAAMADMQISMMEVSFSLGEALEPAANTAAVAMSEFAGWLSDNQDLVDSLGGALNNTLVVAIDAVKTSWGFLEELKIPEALKWLMDNFGPGTDVFSDLFSEIFPTFGDIKDFMSPEKSKFESITNIISDIGPGTSPVTSAAKFAVEESLEYIISKLIGKSNDKSQTLNSSDTFL